MSEPSNVDYTVMSAPKMIEACGDDALAWAQAFMQIVTKRTRDSGENQIDEGLMICWFANAIEAAWQKRSKAAMLDKQPGD